MIRTIVIPRSCLRLQSNLPLNTALESSIRIQTWRLIKCDVLLHPFHQIIHARFWFFNWDGRILAANSRTSFCVLSWSCRPALSFCPVVPGCHQRSWDTIYERGRSCYGPVYHDIRAGPGEDETTIIQRLIWDRVNVVLNNNGTGSID